MFIYFMLMLVLLPCGILYIICLISELVEYRNLLKKSHRTALGEVISREYHHNRYNTSVSYTIKFYDINENEVTRTTENYIMGDGNPEICREHEVVHIIYFDDCNYIFFDKKDLQNQLKNKLYNILGFVIVVLIFIIPIIALSIS